MESVKKIRTELEEKWKTLIDRQWKCLAQIRFGLGHTVPVLMEIDELNGAADELLELCSESEAAANAVREPDADDE